MAEVMEYQIESVAEWQRLQKTFTFIHCEGYRESWKIKRTTFPDDMTLEAIALLEKRYWKSKELRDKFYKEKWNPYYDAIEKAGGKAHCKVTHKYTGGDDPWWLWEISGERPHRGIGFKWVETPKNPINLEIGQKYYEMEQYAYRSLSGRWSKFKNVLDRAIQSYLSDNCPETAGITLRLLINGHSYWYQSTHNKAGVAMWEKIGWPEDEMITKEITV